MLKIDSERPNFKRLSYYELNNTHSQTLLERVGNLKFPNRIVSNMKRYVDMTDRQLSGMKSHDCHIFVDQLGFSAFELIVYSMYAFFGFSYPRTGKESTKYYLLNG